MTNPSSHAVLDPDARTPKAEKIRILLDAALGSRSGLRLLEIGTGSGAIAHHFATRERRVGHVFAVDVSDQRTIREGYRFAVYDGRIVPAADASFDIIVSNHVIEHVGDRALQLQHLREICRTLAPGGVAYIASPNRWQFVEPHFRLPALSWLPRRMRGPYVRLSGRGRDYDCDPMTHREFERLMARAGLSFSNRNVDALLALVRLERTTNRMARLAKHAPVAILESLRHISPTMVYTARRLGAPVQGASGR